MQSWVVGRVALMLCIGGAAFAGACGSTSEPPLGGPYGGNSYKLGPTDGGFSMVDATYTEPSPPVMPGEYGEYGTWTHIFSKWLQLGTIGNCTKCHAPQMPDPKKSYKWLSDEGYMGTTMPGLTGDGSSCLSWYGGDMPPAAAQVLPEARTEMDMWAASGGKNN